MRGERGGRGVGEVKSVPVTLTREWMSERQEDSEDARNVVVSKEKGFYEPTQIPCRFRRNA